MSRLGIVGMVVGVLVIIAVVFFTVARRNTRGLTPLQAAETLDDFLAGRGGDYDFDYFLSVRHADPLVETVRQRCIAIEAEFPSIDGKGYCSADGLREIERLSNELRVASGKE